MTTEQIDGALRAVPWFTAIGRPEVPSLTLPVERVDTWADAERSFRKRSWEDAIQEAQGDLTGHLSVHASARYMEWFTIGPAIKSIVTPIVNEQIERITAGVDVETLGMLMRWTVFQAMMRWEYDDCRPELPRFFIDLWTVYRAGHLPCGWIGAINDWPRGTLVVF